MRKVIFPLAFVACTTLVACSFQARAGGGVNEPSSPPAQPAATTPAASPSPARTTLTPPSNELRPIGKRPAGQASGPSPAPTSTSTSPTPAPTTPPAPTGAKVVSATTIFGSGAIASSGFKGNIYWVDKNTTKLPPLGTMEPAGYLFTTELNVAPQAFTTGFPGVDASRKEYFAIRYEAPLIVTAAADYDFRVVAEDGAILQIDGMTILDNDGVKTAPGDKSGPVHLVAGTHVITVDYLQTTGNVALQVFCKKANEEAEKVCPTQL